MSQVELAKQLGISASYLNLIEHDRRALSAALLIKLTQIFKVDLQSFTSSRDEQLSSDLMEVFADPMFDEAGLTSSEVREFAQSTPTVAQSVLALYRAQRQAQHSLDTLSTQVLDRDEAMSLDQRTLPSEEVSDFIKRRQNHFPELDASAELMWTNSQLDRSDMYRGLVRHLEQVHMVTVRIVEVGDMDGAVRRYIPGRRLLMLSEVLEPQSRNFQLAHQIALLDHGSTFDKILEEEKFHTEETRALARVALANYGAAALLMPYQAFLDAAEAVRYDVDLLCHRFRMSFEQVCHRLTCMRRPGAEGVPFHFVRVDIAGNISKYFSASGMRIARFSGACPRWNIFAAFLTPGSTRVQVSRVPEGQAYFSIARAVSKGQAGYQSARPFHAIELGCSIEHARRLVYADGIDVDDLDAAIPIGVTCRLCERMDCGQRAVPPIRHPLRVDEHVRGISFYAPDEPH